MRGLEKGQWVLKKRLCPEKDRCVEVWMFDLGRERKKLWKRLWVESEMLSPWLWIDQIQSSGDIQDVNPPCDSWKCFEPHIAVGRVDVPQTEWRGVSWNCMVLICSRGRWVWQEQFRFRDPRMVESGILEPPPLSLRCVCRERYKDCCVFMPESLW